MAAEEKVTFCRICEPLCGMVATVEDGQAREASPRRRQPAVPGLRVPEGDRDGRDPERPRPGDPPAQAQRRRRVRARLVGRGAGRHRRAASGASLDERGPGGGGLVHGQPGGLQLLPRALAQGLPRLHRLAARLRRGLPGREQPLRRQRPDVRLAAGRCPIPDIERTDFLLVVGANPLVSHGSVLSAPRVRERLLEIEARGGRVVVRRSAPVGDRPPVRAPADPSRRRRVAAAVDDPHDLRRGPRGHGLPRRPTPTGWEELRRLAAGHPPEATEAFTGIAPDRVRELARDFAGAESAAAYGRTGSCLGRFGTLVAFLLDALNAVTGNVDRPGGRVFGDPPIAARRAGRAARAGHLRRGPRPVRRLPRRAGRDAGLAAAAGDHDPGRAPDAGAVRLRRQPGAVGARRRRARGGARRARPAWSRSTST